jgi:hypothetical protein
MKDLAAPNRLARLALLPLLLAGVACPGTLSDLAAFESAGSDAGVTADAGSAPACPDVPTVFMQSCGVAGCHDATTKAEALDLASPGVAARLVGVLAVEGNGLLIDPASPPASVVYTKLTATPPFGGRMPTGTPLDDATIQCVLSWATSEASQTFEDAGSPSGDDGGAPAHDGGANGDASTPSPFTTIRVAAGQTTAVTDATGNVWSADEDFTGGTAAVQSPTAAITGTDTPALYNGQRYGDPSFSYLFTVPNGTYTVTLKFAEQYVTGPGMREFDVAINGATVETNFDIYAAAGAMNAAVDEPFTVSVTSGSIQIAFTQGTVQFPKVDAIQITQGATAGEGGT